MKFLLTIALFLWPSPIVAATSAQLNVALDLLKNGSCDQPFLDKAANLINDEINSLKDGNRSELSDLLKSGCPFEKYPHDICENRTKIKAHGSSLQHPDAGLKYVVTDLLGFNVTDTDIKNVSKNVEDTSSSNCFTKVALSAAIKAKNIFTHQVASKIFTKTDNGFVPNKANCVKAVVQFQKDRNDYINVRVGSCATKKGESREQTKKKLCRQYPWLCKKNGGR